jgi:hypothetical protein
MNYLVLSQPSEAYAEAISRSLWAISRPEKVRDEKDVSQLYTSWLVHPQSGAVALFLPNEGKPVHELGDIDTFCGLVGDPDVTIDGNTEPMSDYLNSLRGGRVNPLELIQATAYTAALKTQQQLEADGWFPETQ